MILNVKRAIPSLAAGQECRDIVESYFLCVARGTCEEFYVDACYNDYVANCIAPLIASP